MMSYYQIWSNSFLGEICWLLGILGAAPYISFLADCLSFLSLDTLQEDYFFFCFCDFIWVESTTHDWQLIVDSIVMLSMVYLTL